MELLYLRSYWYSINRGEKARLISDDQRQEIRGRNASGVKNKRTTSRRVPFLIERVKKRCQLQNNTLPAKLETSRRDHHEHRLKKRERPAGGTWQQFIKVSFSSEADKSRTN